jgi:hypothetical protein
LLTFYLKLVVLQEIEEEDRLWQAKGKKHKKKQPSSDDSKDASTPKLQNPTRSVGIGSIVRDESRHLGATEEAGDRPSPHAPRTFY